MLTKPTALFPHPGNNGTFSQLWATAEMDQNTNKERPRGAREDCLVWKPAELSEECGIMKMAYLIIWYLKYVFFFPSEFIFPLLAPPLPPLSSSRYVCQWVSELWTRRGIPVRQPSADSATPRLWREGAACEHRDPAVSTTIILQLAHTQSVLGRGFPVWASLWLCICLFVCVSFCHVQCLGETHYVRLVRKGSAV